MIVRTFIATSFVTIISVFCAPSQTRAADPDVGVRITIPIPTPKPAPTPPRPLLEIFAEWDFEFGKLFNGPITGVARLSQRFDIPDFQPDPSGPDARVGFNWTPRIGSLPITLAHICIARYLNHAPAAAGSLAPLIPAADLYPRWQWNIASCLWIRIPGPAFLWYSIDSRIRLRWCRNPKPFSF